MPTSPRPSIAREDYLQTILQLDEDHVPVIRARLAERLGVSAPSVSEAVRGLADDDLVSIEDRNEISLTTSGRELAENIVRRHRVAERILVDLLGLDWAEAHGEAHLLEHGLSDRVVDAAMEVLGYPTTCPHGSPIPGADYDDPAAIPISDIAAGQRFRVERVGESVEARTDVMAYLDANGMRPGAVAVVNTTAPDGAISIAIADDVVAIGPPITAQIYVTSI